MGATNTEQESNHAALPEAARATMVSAGFCADEKIARVSGQSYQFISQRRKPCVDAGPMLRVKMMRVAL